MMQGRLPGRAVCLEAMKKYPHALKWQDIKDKIRNMPSVTLENDQMSVVGK